MEDLCSNNNIATIGQVFDENEVHSVSSQKEDQIECSVTVTPVEVTSTDKLNSNGGFSIHKITTENISDVLRSDDTIDEKHLSNEMHDPKVKKIIKIDELMAKVKDELETVERSLKDAEKENEKRIMDYKKEINWLIESKEELQQRLQSWINIKDEVMHWKRKHDDIERKMEKIRDKMEEKDEEIRFLRDDNQRLAEKSKKNGHKKDLKKLKDENEKLKDENANLNLQLQDKAKMVKCLYGQVSRVEEVVNGYKSSYDEMKTALTSENVVLKTNVRSLKNRLKKFMKGDGHVEHKRQNKDHLNKEFSHKGSETKQNSTTLQETVSHSAGYEFEQEPSHDEQQETVERQNGSLILGKEQKKHDEICAIDRKAASNSSMPVSKGTLDNTVKAEGMPPKDECIDKQNITHEDSGRQNEDLKIIVEMVIDRNHDVVINQQKDLEMNSNDDKSDLEATLDFFIA